MLKPLNLRTALAAAALSLFAVQALAAGSGASGSAGSSGGGTAPASPKKMMCKKGEALKTMMVSGKKVQKCMKPKVGMLTDDELYDQARLLAKEDGEYDWALSLFELVENKQDPKVLNYMGYSNRKAGRLETGIAFYQQALAIDPNFVLAREYLGEGYVVAGRIDLAKVQLGEIKSRAGVDSEEYKDLFEAITKAKA